MKYASSLLLTWVVVQSTGCYTVVRIGEKPERDVTFDFAAYTEIDHSPSELWTYYYDTHDAWWNHLTGEVENSESIEVEPLSTQRNYGRRKNMPDYEFAPKYSPVVSSYSTPINHGSYIISAPCYSETTVSNETVPASNEIIPTSSEKRSVSTQRSFGGRSFSKKQSSQD